MRTKTLLLFSILLVLFACKDEVPEPMAMNPDTADKVSVDRFSAEAGHLMVRDASNGLPDANVAVNFDQGPFITQGIGPNGEVVKYYNFDVQPLKAAPIYVLFNEGADAPVSGQLNIIDVIPGDEGYNDFWNVNKVMVPDDYLANSVTSYDEIMANGYTIEQTSIVVNCPVVPEGSTASMRFTSTESTGLTRGWYKSMVVFYFSFEEKMLTGTISGGEASVPVSDILVTFNRPG